eukprot:jgi/Chrpa1/3096/Chrysochromulina_OHIO_Genome00007096-RA
MSPAKPQTAPYRYRIATGRLAELAAVTSPPSSCELHHGDTLDATLRRQCLDLARRNLQGFAIWDGAGKREELCHEDTRVVALRQGGGLLGYATYRLTKEEGVDVAYLYELHLEERARGLRLGSALVEEVEQRGRQGGAAGLMLTVHLANESARRFYTDKLHFEVSPISPASCAPPVLAAGCDYEVLQRLWDLAARSRLQKRGAEARRELYTREIEQGRLKVSLVMKRGGATGEAAGESVGAAEESWQRKKSRR